MTFGRGLVFETRPLPISPRFLETALADKGVYSKAPFRDPNYLLDLIIKRTEMFFSEKVHLLTTSHRGRLDGAWIRERNEFSGEMEWRLADHWANHQSITVPTNYWNLISHGELVYRYCHHPEANPKLVAKTSRTWPMLVEMRLPRPTKNIVEKFPVEIFL